MKCAARADRYHHEEDDSEAESETEQAGVKGSPLKLQAHGPERERDSGCETPPVGVPADLMFRSFSSCSPRFTKEFRSLEVLTSYLPTCLMPFDTNSTSY